MALFRKRPPSRPESEGAAAAPADAKPELNPAAAANLFLRKRQHLLLGAMGLAFVTVAGWQIYVRSSSSPSAPLQEQAMQPALKMGDTVNRNITQQEWIARSESEMRDMQSRIALIEKAVQSMTANRQGAAERDVERRRDLEDGRRVISAYQQDNARLQRELEQARRAPPPPPNRFREDPVPGAPGPNPGSPEPFRVEGAQSGRASPALRGGPQASLPGVPEVRTISFSAAPEKEGGPGRARTGFQPQAPVAEPTALEDSPDYLPPNSYAPATVIVGVDAPAGVPSQSDPLPVLLRITGPARSVLANGRVLTTRLEGCVVNGAARGDLSSEKVYVKLVRMTCDQPSGRVAISDVKGFISFAGKTGVRGRVVSREGDLITRSFLAGVAGGFGRGFAANSQIALRPGGTLITGGEGGSRLPELSPGQIAAGGLGEGVSSAGDMLSRYFIERAEQYQPVIEMPTGIEVHVVFLEGVYVRGGRP